MKKSLRSTSSSSNNIDTFLKQVRNLQTVRSRYGKAGRLVFMIDATASRQPAWDQACRIQGEMFRAVEKIGTLQVQLVYFRGFGEFHASPWLSDSRMLLREMTGVSCLAGQTQIHRALQHLLGETRRMPVSAAVYIGDACEEAGAGIARLAGQLGVHKTPVFMFQENRDQRTADIYENVASLSGGAYCRFDSNSADLLSELLSAVAVYATGGKEALALFAGNKTPLLQNMTKQLSR